MKSNGSTGTTGSFSSAWNARRSLNLLKMSLNHSNTLPILKDDTDIEMEIDEKDVEMPCTGGIHLDCQAKEPIRLSTSQEGLHELCEAQMGDEILLPASNAQRGNNVLEEKEPVIHSEETHRPSSSTNMVNTPCSIGIVPCQTSSVLITPTLSTSPVTENYSRKCLRTSSSTSASHKILQDSISGEPNVSIAYNSYPLSSSCSRASKNENLAASLQRGLQIIDNQQRSSSARRSTFKFSIALSDGKPVVPIHKADVGIQTLADDPELAELATYVCSSCKKVTSTDECDNPNNDTKLQLVPVDESALTDKLNSKIPRVY